MPALLYHVSMTGQFDFTIRKKSDLIEAVDAFGIVPLFCNSIPGFSVEEHVAPGAWFDSSDGVWEWKGPVIRETGCAYGKFLEHKAVFIGMDWFPDFANYRRNGYTFKERVQSGLVYYQDTELYELLSGMAPVLSKELKAEGNYRKGGRTGFDTAISRLQAQCFAVISDFVYETDRWGNRYGWGVAEYSTPEVSFGEDFMDCIELRSPEESLERIMEHFRQILPWAEESAIRKILR